ncbi:hypothetical protein K5X82_15580 [Halosquirtibacter xylanolyticus]|uniref:hypothetical protein n=1 Tax=Halosquirtibacter xylanolyticus TaxID=3374599 RepID=UPI003747C93A|nr:hypothetical protein K5X82_15580 [Prolixibacteraceae bacterium]
MFFNLKKLFTLFIILLFTCLIPNHSKAALKDSVKIGGAVRFNYRYKAWDPSIADKGGDFVFDMFAIKASAQYANFFMKAEYRLYPSDFGRFLKEGYIGYKFTPELQMVVGTNQVPFGITPYTSHSYFFNMQYYLGFEDDYDNGAKLTYNNDKWIIDLAYYKNAEGGSGASNERYSYDPVDNVEEIGQLNLKIEKPLDNISIGTSVQYGKIWERMQTIDDPNDPDGDKKIENPNYHKKHDTWAAEVHMNGNFLSNKRLNVRLEAMYYNYADMDNNLISMGAYKSSYDVASEASIFSAAIAYTLPIEKKFLDYIQFYNDYSYMKKGYSGFADSQMNVTGMMLAAGPIYTYVDYATGKNQDWFGAWGNGLGQGDTSADWEAWFNINIGYYF